MDVDAKSQGSKDPHYKVLEAHEREKKKKYLEACLEQRWHFSPFVASTDGLLGKEHCHSPSHSSMFMGLLNPNESDEQPLASVGGKGWPRASPEVKYL
jgi:hypothetical protein